jgi:hypothetical protein
MAFLHPPQRRESAPVLWACFCREWLQLSASHTEAWWQALAHARWSRATELRSMVQAQSALAQDWRAVVRLYEATLTPAALIAVLEDLITEARLAPGLARRIEDAVLRQTTQHGQWK